jgi:hypothetical protein
MPDRRVRVAAAAASALLALATLAACAPEPGATPTTSSEASMSPTPIATITPGASPSATPTAAIPSDCEEMLTDDVLADLAGIPLNDPDTGIDGGEQADGSLVCLWRDPAADTTYLMTTISAMSRGPALDLLNQLADEEDFECYTPDGGTRCEKTWENETYPVIDGRTLFWRDGILIDTQYSNLAPPGYTAAIVAGMWG